MIAVGMEIVMHPINVLVSLVIQMQVAKLLIVLQITIVLHMELVQVSII